MMTAAQDRPIKTETTKQGTAHSYLTDLLPYLAITVLTLILYFPFLLPGMGNLRWGDYNDFHVPFLVYTSQELAEGNFPTRTNAMLGGYPIYQDPQFGILYPINLAFGLLVNDFARESIIDLYMLVNLAVVSLASLFFLRALPLSRTAAFAGACAISLNGFITVHSQYIVMIQVMAMSLIAAGFLIRFYRTGAVNLALLVFAALFLAFGHLAGNPQPIMYFHYAIAVGVAVLSFRLWQKTGQLRAGVRMALGGIAAFCMAIVLAAVHLVPAALLIRISARADIEREAALWSAINLPQLSMLLFPGFYQSLPWQTEWPFYNPHIVLSFTNLTEGYIPLGVFGIALGMLGWVMNRRSWPVNILGLSSLFLLACSVGDNLPFYGWLYEFVPGFKMVRVSTRILFLFYPAWGMMVALGVESIWQRQPSYKMWSRWVAGTVIALVLALAGYFFLLYDNWTIPWIGSFIPEVKKRSTFEYFGTVLPLLFGGFKRQIALGLFFLITMVLLFGVHTRFRRLQTAAVIAIMLVELGLYAFGWNITMHTPPLDDVESVELKAFPEKPEGRIMVTNGILGGPANSALYLDLQLSNGYSVTYDAWVGAFQPQGLPPWSLGIQSVLCDLWNVSDINFPVKTHPAIINGQHYIIGDWGWSTIGRQPAKESGIGVDIHRSRMPASVTFDFETTQPIRAFHVMGFAGESASFPNDLPLARVTVEAQSGDLNTTTMLLGRQMTDPHYPVHDTSETLKFAHSRAPVFTLLFPGQYPEGIRIYDGKLDLPTSAPLTSVTVEAVAPFPVTLSLTHLAAELEDGSLVIREAFEVEGFRRTKSRRPELYTLHRHKLPGFVRVVPRAITGSYKKQEYLWWRLFGGEIDPMKAVVLDKRKITDTEVAQWNAPDPEDFESTATITWSEDHESAEIQAKSNQPGWVFLSYAYDAGWTVKVNGRKVQHYRANGPFMAIPVEAGESRIEMTFRPVGLIAGGIMTGLGLLACIFVLVKNRHWRHRLEF